MICIGMARAIVSAKKTSESVKMESLPYDVVIDSNGVWYGPAGTEPCSRDWELFTDVQLFFSIVCYISFDLNVISWRVRK
jgi:hypothetical protein